MRRKIFPTLMNRHERRCLAKLSTESGHSQSGVIRDLILREEAGQRREPSRWLAKMCRRLILQLLRDKTYQHRALLLREVRHFLKMHGPVPELEEVLEEQER